MRNRRLPRALSPALLPGLLALGAALHAAPAAGQSAAELLQRAADRYEGRMEGIDDYTVVQTVMGFEVTAYYERTEIDGHPVFVQREVMGTEAAQQAPDNPTAAYREIADHARLEGSETVDGVPTRVIAVDDFSEVDLSVLQGPGGEQGGEWTPESMRIWMEEEQLVPRRMVMAGTMQARGEAHPVTLTLHFRDYREVEGMLHPFRMDATTEGMADAMGMTDEELAEMQRQMEELEAQLEQMPAQQREMMERMLAGQLDRMREMLASGSMDFTVEVQEVRVNAGPPEGS